MIKWNELAEQIFKNNTDKGWWSTPRTKDEILMLVITEIAEATEEVRKGTPDLYFGIITPPPWDTGPPNSYLMEPKMGRTKPEGESVEIVDAIIRMLDFSFSLKIDVDEAMTVSYLIVDPIWFEGRSSLSVHFSLCNEIVKLFNLISGIGDRDDIAIKIGDFMQLATKYCESRKWDLEKVLKMKMEYNSTRPHRHGGKLY